MNELVAWLPALPAVLVAIAVLLLPGLVATAPLRVGIAARLALSGSASVAFIGLAGVVFGMLRIPFAIWQPVFLALLVLALTLALRARSALRLPRERVRWWALALTWLAASVLIALVAFAFVPSPERFSQTYDNVFHLSAIAHILDTGDASSLTLRTLIETGKTWSFYPAAWHSLVALTVQLTGASVPVAVNAAWIAVCAALWLPGVAWLAQLIVRRFEQGRVAFVALPIGASFGAMPYALLSWGTLYPTFLATALLPTAVAVPYATWMLRRTVRRAHRRRVVVIGVLGTLGAIAAVGFAQPRVLATWVVLLAPFALATAVRAFRRARRAGGVRRRRAGWALAVAVILVVVGAVGGFAYLVLRLGLFTRPLDDRLGGPQAKATQPVWEGLWQVLAQSWPTGIGGMVVFPAVLLALAVLIGGIVAWRTRGIRWVVVTYAIVAVLFAFAAGSDDVVTKLATALWYKDRYRLSSALPVLGVALATLGILTAARWAGRRRAGTLAVAVGWLTALTSAAALVFGGASASIGFAFRLPDNGAASEVLSRAQIDFMGRVADMVPADQRLLGDPWDGSGLSLLFAGREPVFPHVNGQWDAARQTIAWRLQDIDSDPAVCAALDELRVRYVLYHPHEFGGGDPSGNHFIGVHTAVEAGLFEPVLTDGDSTLYRIDQCGVLPR